MQWSQKVARVFAREDEGGHTVPEDKIRARYQRGGALNREAVLKADKDMAFDNSGLNVPQVQCHVFSKGWLVSAAPHQPDWIRTVYARDLIL